MDYLKAQLAAGADAVQLFDSWLGLLDPVATRRWSLPYTRRIFAEVAPLAPTIHFSTGTASLLEEIAGSGCAAVSVDWRLPLDVAWERLGPHVAIQGNLDPALVLAPWPAVEAGVRDVLDGRAGERGTYSISGMASFPRATRRPWRASLVLCTERLERVVIGESAVSDNPKVRWRSRLERSLRSPARGQDGGDPLRERA